jgi:hypothetical protein
MENPFYEEQPILGGRVILATEDNEFRMSLWVRGFGLKDAVSGEWLLELNSNLDLNNWEEQGDLLKICFRIYPDGAKHYDVVIDPFNRAYTYEEVTVALDTFSDRFKLSE